MEIMKKNQNPEYKFIFDLDGTLYTFDQKAGTTFGESRFYQDIKENVYRFFMDKLGLSLVEAQQEYIRLKEKYNGEISLAVEQEFGVNRYEYFKQTWNLEPKNYLSINPKLSIELLLFSKKAAILSAAPNIWVQTVLRYLDIADIFGDQVFTGEPDLRKPNEQVFLQVATALKTDPQLIFSIGDQEYSDIIPAQKLGMKTMLIGTPKKSEPDFFAPDVMTAITLLKNNGII